MHLHGHCQGVEQVGASLDGMPTTLDRHKHWHEDEGYFEGHSEQPVHGASGSEPPDAPPLRPAHEGLDGETEIRDGYQHGLNQHESADVTKEDSCNGPRHETASILPIVKHQHAELVNDEHPEDGHKATHGGTLLKQTVGIKEGRPREQLLTRICKRDIWTWSLSHR